MNRTAALLLMSLSLIALPAKSSVEIEVARQADVDYARYNSFSFRVKEGIPPKHPLGEKGDLFILVRDAAAEELQDRGMVRIEGGEPDIWISFFGLRDEELAMEGTSRHVGPITWVGDPNAHWTSTVLTATLIIEISDGSSGERVWSGWATGKTSNPEKLRKKADKVARRILREFPRD